MQDSEFIIKLVKDLNITYGKLAIIIGCHRMTIYKWTTGQLNPSNYQIALLSALEMANRIDNEIGKKVLRAFSEKGYSYALFTFLKVVNE